MKEWVEGRQTHQSNEIKGHIILMFNEAIIHTWTIHSLHSFSLSLLFNSTTSTFTPSLSPPYVPLPPHLTPTTTQTLSSIYLSLYLSFTFKGSSKNPYTTFPIPCVCVVISDILFLLHNHIPVLLPQYLLLQEIDPNTYTWCCPCISPLKTTSSTSSTFPSLTHSSINDRIIPFLCLLLICLLMTSNDLAYVWPPPISKNRYGFPGEETDSSPIWLEEIQTPPSPPFLIPTHAIS